MSSASIKATKGQAATLTFSFFNPDGSIYSLAGCTVSLVVRPHAAIAAILNLTGTNSGNVSTFALTSTQTDQEIRVYPSILSLIDAQGRESDSKAFGLYITNVQVSDAMANITVGNENVTIATTVSEPENEVDKYYRQDFGVSTTVTVNHNLGKRPSITVVDSAGDEVECTVQHVNDNECILSLAGGFSGSVFCN
jgi:hypothetical protein